MRRATDRRPADEEGYILLGALVAVAIVLILLSVAAAKTAFDLRREREVESMRRANQFVRAIRLFYLKNGHYPTSLQQLDNTNHVRFLRQDYVDPLTGKPNWRLIFVGQNQTTVKGFFGEPLTGLPSTGLGSASGMQSSGIPGPGTAGASAGTGFGGTSSSTSAAAGSTQTGSSDPSTSNSSSASSSAFGSSTGGSSTSGGMGSVSATSFAGSSGPIMGVGTAATGPSISTPNGQSTYETWEFLYDPRIELLKQKAALNAGVGSADASQLGSSTAGGAGSSIGAQGAATPGSSSGSATSGATSPGGFALTGGNSSTGP